MDPSLVSGRPVQACRNPQCDRHTPDATRFCTRCDARQRRHGDPNYFCARVKNTACGIPGCPDEARGKHCPKHARRIQRHGDPNFSATESSRVKRVSRKRCKNYWCAGLRRRGREECGRCLLARKRNVDPRRLRRGYRKLCAVSWCWKYACNRGMCWKHRLRLRKFGSVLNVTATKREAIPKTCTIPSCNEEMCARGLCLTHLIEKAKAILLLREYLPREGSPPWHRFGRCIGRPNCRRKAVLLGRCPDCLWDWQFSLMPPRRYLR